jgi:hypothetical protein
MIFGPDLRPVLYYWLISTPLFFLIFVAITWLMARFYRLPGGTLLRCFASVAVFWFSCAAIAYVNQQLGTPPGTDRLPWLLTAFVTAGILAPKLTLASSALQAGVIWLGQLILGIPVCWLAYLGIVWVAIGTS